MLNLQTPGVYLREVEVPQPPLLRMSVTGLVGQAERGPLNSPQRIENLGQFRDIFGDLVGYSYLPYSIFGFFLSCSIGESGASIGAGDVPGCSKLTVDSNGRLSTIR